MQRRWVRGEEANNNAQEQPSVDQINATTMGDGVDINITQERPSMDEVYIATMGGEEDHEAVHYDLVVEGTTTANGSCDFPETHCGLDVLDDDEDWMLHDDDVGG